MQITGMPGVLFLYLIPSSRRIEQQNSHTLRRLCCVSHRFGFYGSLMEISSRAITEELPLTIIAITTDHNLVAT